MNYEDIEAIAIVGMTVRVPGARTTDELWHNIYGKIESVTWFNPAQLDGAGVPRQLYGDPAYVPAAAVLTDADQFDAEFFGISRSEATMLDPQHRVFLECAWEALEDAGYDPHRFEGMIGVYGGCYMNRYIFNLYTNEEFARSPLVHYAWRYNDKDFITGQVAYQLNLRGPAITVQTACSTSLVATHLACQALLSHDCDIALAGGVTIRVPLSAGYLAPEGAMFSPDGRCRPFDAAANGAVPGEGCAIVALKRLSDAIADGDNVRAVIRAAAINNDGRNKVSFAAPNPEGQMRAIIAAHTMAAVNPDTIGYVEAHGTGTRLGDPIEVSALTDAFRLRTKRRNFCALGSLKANIGHLDAAAGAAGLIRAVLALERKCIPPQANFVEPNRELKLDTSPFYVPTEPQEWKSVDGPRRAAVSAFAVGGTNAHVILEEAPPRAVVNPRHRPHELLVLSGHNKKAVDAVAGRLANHIDEHLDQNLASVAFTLSEGRSRLQSRRFVVAADAASAARALREPAQVVTSDGSKPRIVFMFPGVGTQYPDMTLDIYDSEPEFRKQVDLCASIVLQRLGMDVRHYLFPSRYPGVEVDRESVPHVLSAIFTVEYALAMLWQSWGVKPDAMLGHSLGEYVAACLAGVLSLPDALGLSVRRGRLFDLIPEGRMMGVPLSASEIKPFLGDKLSLGAVNAPELCLVSGLNGDLEALSEKLAQRGVTCRVLPVRMASHSYLVDPYLDGFTRTVAEYHLSPPTIPYLSCLTGNWIRPEEATDPGYWARQLRSPVQFEAMVRTALSQLGTVLLEVGPGNTLCTLAGAQHAESRPNAIPSLRHPNDPRTDFESLLGAAGRLWQSGVTIDLKSLTWAGTPQRESLPTYPFQRKRYWVNRGKAIGPGSSGEEPGYAAEGTYSPEVDPIDVSDNIADVVMSERERAVVGIWQSHLGCNQIGLDDNFESVGGHSLLAAQMLPHLRALSDAPIKITDFFGSPTIRKLAALIDAAGIRSAVDLSAEVVLDPAIRASGLPAARPGKATAVLLTGATGFLGAFLLSELLQQTEATVYCLVRAVDPVEGEQRLLETLRSNRLPAPKPGRLVVVPGDLEKPRLGVPAADYEVLAGRLDAIYHCGARVNFVRPYSVLKTANVLGTEEVLRLATRHRLKTVHYVSTLFVNVGAFGTGATFVAEEDPLPPPVGHSSSYTESKWVAEGLCRLAAERGVPVVVYRPGNVLGHQHTGICNPEDFFTKFVQGCIDLGLAPRRRAAYPVGTVDDVARMLVMFSLQEDAIGRTFHLVHPEVLEWEDMFGHFDEFGYEAPLVSWDEWHAAFVRKLESGSDNVLLPLTDMIDNVKVDNHDWPRFGVENSKRFRERLGQPYPVLDRSYFARMYGRLAESGLLPTPTLKPATHSPFLVPAK
ncbi:type I polyketide synthase [Bradyrhizobium sp. HKCCYLRH1065]|uniref:type I polyketide synthase n=1 Tax=Bradyrhizobium sp. HKCCYLRH1065 TaxID=3420753 RepID=UPI003EC0C10E